MIFTYCVLIYFSIGMLIGTIYYILRRNDADAEGAYFLIVFFWAMFVIAGWIYLPVLFIKILLNREERE